MNIKRTFAILSLVLAAVATSAACGKFTSPPIASISGLNQGVLSDPAAPVVLKFSKPIDFSSLKIKIVKFEPNAEGQLADETGDPTVDLAPLFSHDDLDGDQGGVGTLDATGTTYSIKTDARLPVGPKLALLIEPGLSDVGHEDTAVTTVRKRLLFAYSFSCSGTGTTILTSGPYFFLLDVENPVGTQVKVFGNLNVDSASGKFVAQFTFAQRLTDPNRCSPACENGNVCKTLPGPPACVVPSQRAGATSEWPDFFPNPTPPIGFSFTANGCAEDQMGGTVTFATEPTNMIVEQPAVQINGLVLTAQFTKSAAGDLNGSGSVSGDNIVLGQGSLGPGTGTTIAQSIPASLAPPNIPAPTTSPDSDF
ncbi:MAG: hypothetical protein ABI461_17110 [Polyangiaceae bacterium]